MAGDRHIRHAAQRFDAATAQQPHHFGVLDEQQPHLRRFDRAAAHQQHGARLGLQRAQPLRYSRLRDRQALRRTFKAAFLDDCREAFERVGVEDRSRGVMCKYP